MPRRAAKRPAAAEAAEATSASRPKRQSVIKATKEAKQQQQWQRAGGDVKPGIPQMFLLSQGQPSTDKCAAFDIDWCLIKPKSGGKWPKNAADWCWLFSCIPEQLKKLHSDGYRLIFVSNQAGFEKGNVKPEEIMKKCCDIVQQLAVPVDVMLISGTSHFRKPDTGAWDYYVQHCNAGKQFTSPSSIFVGDAAGRPAGKGRSKDFSCTDRMFAANIGLNFKTPEEFFHNEPAAAFDWGGKPPKQMLIDDNFGNVKPKLSSITFHKDQQELLLMVGPPASGKSTICERMLVPHGYVRVNRDLLKTQEKCLKAAEKALSDGKSVVVDNTNAGTSDRAPYIALAKKHKLKVRAIIMKTDLEIAQHLNYFRQSQTKGSVRRVPMVGYRVYNSKFEEPTLGEGLSECMRVDFTYQPDWLSEVERRQILMWTSAGH